MNITRHISLEDEYIEKLKPYADKHNGNFGAALRDMICQAGEYDTRINSSAIDHSLFNWTFDARATANILILTQRSDVGIKINEIVKTLKARLHRDIAGNGNEFDTYVCHTMRETFKGALSYAFGNKARMCAKHLLTHGDNFCEVTIRMS